MFQFIIQILAIQNIESIVREKVFKREPTMTRWNRIKNS